MERFKFNPKDGFIDDDYYKDPLNEKETRRQLQSLHEQTKDFINSNIVGKVIDSLTSNDGSILVTNNGNGGVDLKVIVSSQGVTKGYVDTQDQSILAQAKAYTDSKPSLLKGTGEPTQELGKDGDYYAEIR